LGNLYTVDYLNIYTNQNRWTVVIYTKIF
jgi:hypothetical protein